MRSFAGGIRRHARHDRPDARLLAGEAGGLLLDGGYGSALVRAALALGALAACRGEPARPRPADAIAVVDDAGRTVRLARPARRVVSLVPSVTETVVALGAVDRLVARTAYDRAPEVAHLPSVGGGLDPSLEALVALEPDLVIAWEERSGRGLRGRLEAAGIPVYGAAIQDTAGVFATIARLGEILGREAAAASLARALRDTLTAVAAASDAGPGPRILFLLDGDPPRTAGLGTFVSELLTIAGGEAAYPAITGEWPAIALETVVANPPDVVVVPLEEGETLRLAERPGWRDMPVVRRGRVIGVPADLVSRPGPALARAARALGDSLRALGARTGPF